MRTPLPAKFQLRQDVIVDLLIGSPLGSDKCYITSILLGGGEDEDEVWYLVKDDEGNESEVYEGDISLPEEPDQEWKSAGNTLPATNQKILLAIDGMVEFARFKGFNVGSKAQWYISSTDSYIAVLDHHKWAFIPKESSNLRHQQGHG